MVIVDEDSEANPIYEIRLQGHLDQRWSDWFNGLIITYPSDDQTLLRGRVVDQVALHGMLAKIRDLGLTLLAVERKGA